VKSPLYTPIKDQRACYQHPEF